jgi:succinoglycan biosynthesis protein ExoL
VISSRILFLLSHQPNPRIIKQIKYLSSYFEISVVYFEREYLFDLSTEYEDYCVNNMKIAKIHNGRFFTRIFTYLASVYKLSFMLLKNHHTLVILNNIDVLVLYKLCSILNRYRARTVLEISDLRSHTYSDDIRSIILRYIEKIALSYTDKLILTSPKYYEYYYKTIYHNSYFVLENKPLSYMLPQRKIKGGNKIINIGIVGLLLQGGAYKTLFDIIGDSSEYIVKVYGIGRYQSMVEEYADRHENIFYFGEYNFFKDSANIYSSIDILYMPYDTSKNSLNNKAALPNKLYEAMYYQVPIITSSGTYLGEVVENHKIGMTFKFGNKDELLTILNNFDTKKYLYNLKNLKSSVYFADSDYIDLKKYLTETV